MKNRYLIILIIIFTTISLSFKSNTTELDWTIIPIENSKELFEQCSRGAPKKRAIIELDSSKFISAINKILYKKDTIKKHLGKSLSNYKYQLCGYKYKKKEFIYINCISSRITKDNDFDWRKKPIIICDGNSVSWGIVYCIKTDELIDFQTNGPIWNYIEKI